MHLPTLYAECSDFLAESQKTPLLKNLPVHYDGFKKVKVRKKNKQDAVIEAFNKSFSQHKNAFQRSVFANGKSSFIVSEDASFEPFYIFPINGYKYVYNPVVTNFANEYKENIERLTHNIPQSVAIDMVSMVISKSYTDTNLVEGINLGAEIIIYSIPYYYAIRKSLLDDYSSIDYNI